MRNYFVFDTDENRNYELCFCKNCGRLPFDHVCDFGDSKLTEMVVWEDGFVKYRIYTMPMLCPDIHTDLVCCWEHLND